MKKQILFIALFCYFTNAPALSNDKQLVGIVEKVKIIEKNILVKAKLDTGASMSSLSAQDITLIKREGRLYVRFKTYLTPNKMQLFTEPFLGYTSILKRRDEYENKHCHLIDQKYSVRPIIPLLIAFGNQKSLIRVNLVDRRQFRYPMLLGIDALKKFNVLIDVNRLETQH